MNEIEIKIPFNWLLSKNNRMGYSGITKRSFIKKEAREVQDSLILLIKNRVGDFKFKKDKIWISIFVQKPTERGDAINFVDVICDSIKKAVGIDDRWFSIKVVDWEIAEENPQIFIKIEQLCQKAIRERDHCIC